jgi:hypothetical protein
MDDMERLGQVVGDLAAENAAALGPEHTAPMPPLGEPGITVTTVKDLERMRRLLRITCSEHGILSETTWTDEELTSVDGQYSSMEVYLRHVVGAHREPYGANCQGTEVNVELFDGDRAPVTIVWKVPEYSEFPKKLAGVFATPGDAERWINDQRVQGYSFEAEDFNVLHYLSKPLIDESEVSDG